MTPERWQGFTKSQQLLFIGSELERARVWQGKDEDNFRGALARGLELVDLSLADPQWRDNLAMILGLRQEMAKFYIGQGVGSIETLYSAL
ncbi:MAG: hypothetical protein AAB686_01585 [Patescibacteria group bacterium]